MLCAARFNSLGQELNKVVIIRHGEKPVKGNNLSCQGLNRSLELASVLFKKYNLPDHIFVPDIKSGKSTNQSRMYQTIIPFAVKYNIDIDTRYSVDDTKNLADGIMKIKGYVLVVWSHEKIPAIVNGLGIKDKNLNWKSDDFDSILVITFTKNGKPQLTIDKENITPSPDCR